MTNRNNDVIPTELHDGDIVKFALDYSDWDSFVITTDKAWTGHIIDLRWFFLIMRIELFFRLHWNGSYDMEPKEWDYFFAYGTAGAHHYLTLNDGVQNDSLDSMEIRLLDGDENELNDTKETATPLPIGTDAAFSIGGIGDADWFSF